MEWTMARDQYGNTYHDLGKYPRKALLDRLGFKHADKMYRDNLLTKKSHHTGYVIGGYWLSIYKVFEWKKETK